MFASRSSEACLMRRWRRWIPTMLRRKKSEASRTWKAAWLVARLTSSSSAWRRATRRWWSSSQTHALTRNNLGNELIYWDNVRCPSFKASKLCTYLLICMINLFGELIAVKIAGNKFIGSCCRCLCCFIFSLWKAFRSSIWIFLKRVCYGLAPSS